MGCTNEELIMVFKVVLTVTFLIGTLYSKEIDTNLINLAAYRSTDIIFLEKKHILEILNEHLKVYHNPSGTNAQKVLAILANSTNKSEINYTDFYDQINTIAIHLPGSNGKTTQINDPIIYAIIVSSLSDPNNEISNRAYDILEAYSRKDYIKAFSKYLKIGFQKKGRVSPFVYAFCDLTDEEKNAFFINKSIPLYVKAAAGNKEAENTVLMKFNAAESFEKKIPYISELGFIGSKKCITTLLNELDKEKYTFQSGYKVSTYQVEVLYALARNFPEEDLWGLDTYYLYQQCFSGDKLKKYVEKVTEWVIRNYSIKLEQFRKVDFLCRYIIAD
jgi:hypothetical protein